MEGSTSASLVHEEDGMFCRGSGAGGWRPLRQGGSMTPGQGSRCWLILASICKKSEDQGGRGKVAAPAAGDRRLLEA